jgi:transposase
LDINGIYKLPWPSQSPDLNPIEHVWAYLKKKLAQYRPKNIGELKLKIMKEWNEIPTSFIRRLIDSMEHRVEKVVRAKGGHTNY